MRTPARLLLAAAIVVLPATVHAQLGGTEPYTLKGIMGQDQNAAREAGWFPISVGFLGNDKAPERWIGVTEFLTYDGDPFVGRENLRRLLPDDPVLLLDGPPAMTKQIQQAPAGSRLVVRGMLNPQSRIFMISGVQVKPAGKGK
jgi:hypothetical protein